MTRHDKEPLLTEKCIIVALIKTLPDSDIVIQDISKQTIKAVIDRFRRLERETQRI